MSRQKCFVAVGERYGRWTIIQQGKRPSVWLCRCDCGVEGRRFAWNLVTGQSQSCGCRQAEITGRRSRTHGRSKTTEYRIWEAMRRRCKKHAYYAGRGIEVCEEWSRDFSAFLAHVGPRPSPKHSLDRIDNNGNYEPGNVRWATRKEQMRNCRRNRYLTVGNETLTIAEWSERSGIPAQNIVSRLKIGWTASQALVA